MKAESYLQYKPSRKAISQIFAKQSVFLMYLCKHQAQPCPIVAVFTGFLSAYLSRVGPIY